MAAGLLEDNNCDRGAGGGGSESSPKRLTTVDCEFAQERERSLSSAWKPVWYTGWHTGVLACATSVAVVLFINVGLTFYAITNPKYKTEGNIGTLYSGSCDKSRKIGVWLHLGINAFPHYCCQGVIILSNVSPRRLAVRLMLRIRGDNGWTLGFPVLGIYSGLSPRVLCCGFLLG